jgi:hypothetical protein
LASKYLESELLCSTSNVVVSMTLARTCVLFACLAVVPCAAHADTAIYNNLTSTTSGSDPGSMLGPLFDSFLTPATAMTLTNVELLLWATSSSGSSTVYLLSDNSLSPGAVIDTIGTVSDSSLPSSQSAASVVAFSVSVPLAADTEYWIELAGNAASTDWAWSYDQSAVGVAGQYHANYALALGPGVHVYPNINGPYQMEIGESATATMTPEPMSLLLMGSALLGLAGVLRRKSAV